MKKAKNNLSEEEKVRRVEDYRRYGYAHSGFEAAKEGGESRLTQMMREYARERWVGKADFVRFYGRE